MHHENTPRRPSRWRLVLPATAALAVIVPMNACGDRGMEPTAPRAPGMIAAFESPELLDPSIDGSDTYVLTQSVTQTTTTVSSTQPFYDPATQQQVTSVTLATVVDSTRSEAGYQVDGTVRIGQWTYDNDLGSKAQRVQIVGNTATFYDAAGAIVNDTSGPVLMDAIGDMTDVVVTDQTVYHTNGTTAMASVASATGPAATEAARGAAPLRPDRVEQRDGRLVATYVLDDAEVGLTGTRVKEYRRSGADWVIDAERETRLARSGAFTVSTVSSTRYPLVRYKSNDAKDAARRERRASRPATPADDAAPPPRVNALIAATPTELCDLDSPCDGSGDGGTTTPPPPTTTTGTTTVPAAMNVVFQHGGISDANTWNRMDPWVSGKYAIGTKVKLSLDWKQGFDTQANTLQGTMVGTGARDFLMIGHSNGGIISRRIAQNGTGAAGSLVHGVITISSPHAGVPLAANGRQFVSEVLTNQLTDVLTKVGGSCWRRQFGWICDRINESIGTVVPNVVNYALDSYVPMSRDVAPGSAFLQQLNSRSETFRKYDIEVHSQGAWKWVRMLGDWKCNPEDRCSGNHLQNAMESAYDVLRTCGSNFLSNLVAGGVAEKCRNVRWSLSNANGMYERLTAPNDDSDGLVPGRSQAYPGVLLDDKKILQNAKESHVGELKSTTVRDNLFMLIDRYRATP